MAKKKKRKPRRPQPDGLPKVAKQWSKKRRITEAALRILAKREKISLSEARQLHKDAYVDIIIKSEQRVRGSWIQVKPGKFRRLPPGKRKERDAVGPIVGASTVSKSIRMAKYWEQVRILSEEYGRSIKQVRRLIKAGVIDPKEWYPKKVEDEDDDE